MYARPLPPSVVPGFRLILKAEQLALFAGLPSPASRRQQTAARRARVEAFVAAHAPGRVREHERHLATGAVVHVREHASGREPAREAPVAHVEPGAAHVEHEHEAEPHVEPEPESDSPGTWKPSGETVRQWHADAAAVVAGAYPDWGVFLSRDGRIRHGNVARPTVEAGGGVWLGERREFGGAGAMVGAAWRASRAAAAVEAAPEPAVEGHWSDLAEPLRGWPATDRDEVVLREQRGERTGWLARVTPNAPGARYDLNREFVEPEAQSGAWGARAKRWTTSKLADGWYELDTWIGESRKKSRNYMRVEGGRIVGWTQDKAAVREGHEAARRGPATASASPPPGGPTLAGAYAAPPKPAAAPVAVRPSSEERAQHEHEERARGAAVRGAEAQRRKWLAAIDKAIASQEKKAEALSDPDRKANTARRARIAAGMYEREEGHRARAAMLRRQRERVEAGQASEQEMHFARESVSDALTSLFPWTDSERGYPGERSKRDFAAGEGALARAVDRSMEWAQEHARKRLEYVVEDAARRGKPAPRGVRGLLRDRPLGWATGKGWREWAAAAAKADPDKSSGWRGAADYLKTLRVFQDVTGKDDPTRADVVGALRSFAAWREAVSGETPKRAAGEPAQVMRDPSWSPTPERAERVADADRRFQHVRSAIKDYFPTPPALTERLIEAVRPEAGDVVLEPSAGEGHMADRLPADVKIHVVEQAHDNREALKKKGYDLRGDDFLDYRPQGDDRPHKIIMNPPFSEKQDIRHVRHAYDILRPGGSVAAIVGEGAFFREHREDSAFRDWLDEVGAHVEHLPEDAFKRSGTAVRSRMVTIHKPHEVAEVARKSWWARLVLFVRAQQLGLFGDAAPSSPAEQRRAKQAREAAQKEALMHGRTGGAPAAGAPVTPGRVQAHERHLASGAVVHVQEHASGHAPAAQAPPAAPAAAPAAAPTPKEDFRAYIAKLKEEKAARVAKYPKQEGTRFAIFREPRRADREVWLHPTVNGKKGGWRTTHVDTSAEMAHVPFSGHDEHDSYEQAVEQLATEGYEHHSTNVDPVMRDPREAFAGLSDHEVQKMHDDAVAFNEHDKQFGGHNSVRNAHLIGAYRAELDARQRAAAKASQPAPEAAPKPTHHLTRAQFEREVRQGKRDFHGLGTDRTKASSVVSAIEGSRAEGDESNAKLGEERLGAMLDQEHGAEVLGAIGRGEVVDDDVIDHYARKYPDWKAANDRNRAAAQTHADKLHAGLGKPEQAAQPHEGAIPTEVRAKVEAVIDKVQDREQREYARKFLDHLEGGPDPEDGTIPWHTAQQIRVSVAGYVEKHGHKPQGDGPHPGEQHEPPHAAASTEDEDDHDRSLDYGKHVEARWTANGASHRAHGHVVKVNAASVKVKLHGGAPGEEAHAGRVITIPRRWGSGYTQNNRTAPARVEAPMPEHVPTGPMDVTAVSGQTYPVRRELARAGGKWSGEHKAYLFRDHAAGEAAAKQHGLAHEKVEVNAEDHFAPRTGAEMRAAQDERVARKVERLREQAAGRAGKAAAHEGAVERGSGGNDYNFWTQPVIRGHKGSQAFERRREKLREKLQAAHDLRGEAAGLRGKADAVERAHARASDPEAPRRTAKARKEAADAAAREAGGLDPGARAHHVVYGHVEVVKRNPKSIRVRTSSGWETNVDPRTLRAVPAEQQAAPAQRREFSAARFADHYASGVKTFAKKGARSGGVEVVSEGERHVVHEHGKPARVEGEGEGGRVHYGRDNAQEHAAQLAATRAHAAPGADLDAHVRQVEGDPNIGSKVVRGMLAGALRKVQSGETTAAHAVHDTGTALRQHFARSDVHPGGETKHHGAGYAHALERILEGTGHLKPKHPEE